MKYSEKTVRASISVLHNHPQGQSWCVGGNIHFAELIMTSLLEEREQLSTQVGELLGALEELFQIGQVFASAIEANDHGTDFERWAETARTALARAKGQQPTFTEVGGVYQCNVCGTLWSAGGAVGHACKGGAA